jgi:hypothetical protein
LIKKNFEFNVSSINFNFQPIRPSSQKKYQFNTIVKSSFTIRPKYILDRNKIGVLTFEKYSKGPIQLIPFSHYLKRAQELYHVHFHLVTIAAVNFINDVEQGLEQPLSYKPQFKQRFISYIRDIISLKFTNQFYIMLKGSISLNELVQVVLSFKYFKDEFLIDIFLKICSTINKDSTYQEVYKMNRELCEKFKVVNNYDWYYGPWFIPMSATQSLDIQERKLINSYEQDMIMKYLDNLDYQIVKESFLKFCDLGLNNILKFYVNIQYVHRDYPFFKQSGYHDIFTTKDSNYRALQQISSQFKELFIHYYVESYIKENNITDRELTDVEYYTEVLGEPVDDQDKKDIGGKKKKKRKKH